MDGFFDTTLVDNNQSIGGLSPPYSIGQLTKWGRST